MIQDGEKLSLSDFPISPTRDPSLLFLASSSFQPLPLSLTQFDIEAKIGDILYGDGIPFPKPTATARGALTLSYASFKLQPEHTASPLFTRVSKEKVAPLPPPKFLKPNEKIDAPEAMLQKPSIPAKPLTLQQKPAEVKPRLPPRMIDVGPVAIEEKPKQKKSIVSQVKSAIAEMVGESTQESRERWNICGISEPLLAEFPCKCLVMSGSNSEAIRGYLMLSESYLCFISTFHGESRLLHRAILPLDCILFISQGQQQASKGEKNSIEMATSDSVMHTFFGFKKQYSRAINVIHHAWKSARRTTSTT